MEAKRETETKVHDEVSQLYNKVTKVDRIPPNHGRQHEHVVGCENPFAPDANKPPRRERTEDAKNEYHDA